MTTPTGGRSRSNTTTTPPKISGSGPARSHLLSNAKGFTPNPHPRQSLLAIFCSLSYEQLLAYTRSVLLASSASGIASTASHDSKIEVETYSPPPSPATASTKPISVLLFLLDSLAILREYPDEGEEGEEATGRTQSGMMTTGRFKFAGSASASGSGPSEDEEDWWSVWREFVEEMVSDCFFACL